MSDIILLNEENPDSQSISLKRPISYTLDSSDMSYISASSVQLSNTNTFQVLTVPVEDLEPSTGTLYYTPLYTEKISYEQWLTTINKNFRELT